MRVPARSRRTAPVVAAVPALDEGAGDGEVAFDADGGDDVEGGVGGGVGDEGGGVFGVGFGGDGEGDQDGDEAGHDLSPPPVAAGWS
jgi:hypothetical protein